MAEGADGDFYEHVMFVQIFAWGRNTVDFVRFFELWLSDAELVESGVCGGAFHTSTTWAASICSGIAEGILRIGIY